MSTLSVDSFTKMSFSTALTKPTGLSLRWSVIAFKCVLNNVFEGVILKPLLITFPFQLITATMAIYHNFAPSHSLGAFKANILCTEKFLNIGVCL